MIYVNTGNCFDLYLVFEFDEMLIFIWSILSMHSVLQAMKFQEKALWEAFVSTFFDYLHLLDAALNVLQQRVAAISCSNELQQWIVAMHCSIVLQQCITVLISATLPNFKPCPLLEDSINSKSLKIFYHFCQVVVFSTLLCYWPLAQTPVGQKASFDKKSNFKNFFSIFFFQKSDEQTLCSRTIDVCRSVSASSIDFIGQGWTSE